MARKAYQSADPEMPDDIDLPEDLWPTKSLHRPMDDQTRLDALGAMVAKRRGEAIGARKLSGIEDVWMDCEEAYVGIDDANRAEFANAKWAKPTTMDGPVTTTNQFARKAGVKSTAFVRLTSRYVDAGAAKLADILLPLDDKSFKIAPMPVPELILQQQDMSAVLHPITGQPMLRDMTDDEVAAQGAAVMGNMPGATSMPQPQPPAQPGQPPQQVPVTQADLANQKMDELADAAEKCETRIHNWMVECRYPLEVRKVIFDAARIGVGVLKAPLPKLDKVMALTKPEDGTIAIQIKKTLVPVAKWVDPWNLFPDPACGEDVHDGEWILERDFLSPKTLRDLKELPGYLSDQIDMALEEGPNGANIENASPHAGKTDQRFEVWYMYGQIDREDLDAAQAVGSEDLSDDKDVAYAVVTVINDTVIKCDINPLESGKFPYHVMPWQRRPGQWAGVGVSEQINMPQRMANAATRAMMNNAGKSAGSQIIVDQNSVTPADGNWTLTPDKIWYLNPESGIDDVRKAFMAVEFPNAQAQLMAIIEYAFRLAEESCNIPLITQGINGQNTPDTFGATQIQDSNANTLLRSIGYIFDDCITDPVVHAYYEWLLLDPAVPDEEKQEFRIEAHGSAALVERAVQVQTLQQVGQMVLNPAFGVDPRKWFAEMMRSKRLDPRKVQYTEAEQEQMESQPAPPVQVQVAQLKAQSDQQIAQARIQGQLQVAQQDMQHQQQMLANGQSSPHMAAAQAKVQEANIRAQTALAVEGNRAQAELAYAQTERQIAADDVNAKHQEMLDKRDLLMLQYAIQNNMQLQDVRADLTKTAMLEQTKRDMKAAELQMQINRDTEDRNVDIAKHLSTLSPGA